MADVGTVDSLVLSLAPALGIQNVWLINPNAQQVKQQKNGSKKITKNCSVWLTMRTFTRIADCIDALRAEGIAIWATDLSPQALPLTQAHRPQELPPKVAIVIGRETDGVSEEMLKAADRRVYFPIVGFTESLNLSVATALVLQRLLDWFPDIRGDLTSDEKQAIRSQWYPQLVKNPTQALQSDAWIANSDTIEPLGDLRREKLSLQESWVPKRVKQRELAMPEVQERLGKRQCAGKEAEPNGDAQTEEASAL